MGVFSGGRRFITSARRALRERVHSSAERFWSTTPRKKQSSIILPIIALVVISELFFLSHMQKERNDSQIVSNVTGLVQVPPRGTNSVAVTGDIEKMNRQRMDVKACEEFLESEDHVVYSRDFDTDPILVGGSNKDWETCDVGCVFGHISGKRPDASFGHSSGQGTVSVLRSMESAGYYHENNIAFARRLGYGVVMTTSLSSDVPVGYFSWAEYDIMAPVQPKTEDALAAAFISNCGARNFRLAALSELMQQVKIDSYGACHNNKNGNVNKVDTLKRYKFGLAFENTNEEDYVTEKFFQSLVAGTVPVVIGAPNIEDFAPLPDSYLHIKKLEDIPSVVKAMKHLAGSPKAYDYRLRWKHVGPSDAFKALVDMAAVHSSCRLCIHLATMIRSQEESKPGFKKRPCRCSAGSETVHHLFVRERGRFKMESVFLRSSNVTASALEDKVLRKFKSINHVPVWKSERPESIRGGEGYKVYRIYPVGMSQREALYSFKFSSDDAIKEYLEANPCPKFEVIFV